MAFRPATFRYTEIKAYDYIMLPPGHKAWNFELSGPGGSTVEFRVETTNALHTQPLVQRELSLDDSNRTDGVVTEEAYRWARVVITSLTGNGAALVGAIAFQ